MKAGKKERRRLQALAELLSLLKPHQVETLIQFVDNDTINDICTLIFNVVHRDRSAKLGDENIQKLCKCMSGKRSEIIYLTKKKNNVKRKRRILKQSGGFLATLGIFIYEFKKLGNQQIKIFVYLKFRLMPFFFKIVLNFLKS